MSNWTKKMSDIDYINSDVLNDYDIDKHYGLFVYLREDYKGYVKGLWFGGINGWELLSERDGTLINPESAVSLPIHNPSPFYYDGTVKTYYPLNWESISPYCYITGNTNINKGTYEVTVFLKNDLWSWVDGTNTPKTFNYSIEAQKLTKGNIRYHLSSDFIYYGDNFPSVDLVEFNGLDLIEGTDFTVIYPTDDNAGNKFITIEFIGNYTGSISVPFEVKRKPIERPKFSNNIYEYTGEEIVVFPDNWDTIKPYCSISSNYGTKTGSYILTIVLNRNYSWLPDESTSPYIFVFTIGGVDVPVPVWDEDEDKYNVLYTGEIYQFYPLNWEDIKGFVTIDNNILSERGEHIITISLNGDNLVWTDGTKSKKTKVVNIGSLKVDDPIWDGNRIVYYTGAEFEYKPLNWESGLVTIYEMNDNEEYIKDANGDFIIKEKRMVNGISPYCNISDNYRRSSVGTYFVTVTLKDDENYEWRSGGRMPKKSWFEIKQAEGMFIQGPVITGSVMVREKLTCNVKFIDASSQLTYEWYRTKRGEMSDSTLVQYGSKNEYIVQPEDLNCFIICIVYASETQNYTGCVGQAMTNTPVLRKRVDGKLRWEDNKSEDTIYSTSPTYTLPGVIKMGDDDLSWIEYSIVEGNSVADLYTSKGGTLLIKGEGYVIVRATVKDSPIYEYVPDYIDFVLHVYSSDVILWGLYDKDGDVVVAKDYEKLLPEGLEVPEDEVLNEKFLLMNGIVPSTSKVATMKENEKGIHACLFRADFPFKNFYGDEQLYHGWYVLVPTTRVLYEMDENGGTEMDKDGYRLLDKNGEEIIYTDKEGRTYKGFGCFNVGKTSDNWMLHIITRRQ